MPRCAHGKENLCELRQDAEVRQLRWIIDLCDWDNADDPISVRFWYPDVQCLGPLDTFAFLHYLLDEYEQSVTLCGLRIIGGPPVILAYQTTLS